MRDINGSSPYSSTVQVYPSSRVALFLCNKFLDVMSPTKQVQLPIYPFSASSFQKFRHLFFLPPQNKIQTMEMN